MATKITHKTANMSPYRLFKLQIQGTYGAYRRPTYNYLAPNMGGSESQRRVLQNVLVLTTANFEVTNDN